MKRALVLTALLAAGCYKTTYLMQPGGGGMPSPAYTDHLHWSIINLIELSQPVNLQEACPGAAATSIDERVGVLGGILNAVLGTYVPILSVHNATVFCGAPAGAIPTFSPGGPPPAAPPPPPPAG